MRYCCHSMKCVFGERMQCYIMYTLHLIIIVYLLFPIGYVERGEQRIDTLMLQCEQKNVSTQIRAPIHINGFKKLSLFN